MKNAILGFSAFVVCAALVRFARAECSDYQGFWVADYDKGDHRDYIEMYVGPDSDREMRETYYQKPGQRNLLRGHDYGRLKDSLGKCFGIIDTAQQVDSNGLPAGHVLSGKWFEFEYDVKVIEGSKRIFEVTPYSIKDNQGIVTVFYDTVDIRHVSDAPAFKNVALFTKPGSMSTRPISRWNPNPIPLAGFQLDGRRIVRKSKSSILFLK